MNKDCDDGITISIVSHNQNYLVNELLTDLLKCEDITEIIITQNIPDKQILSLPFKDDVVKIIKNKEPMGFGANHNQAFTYCKTNVFAVVNPDVRIRRDPFPCLLSDLDEDTGITCPITYKSNGALENSARVFPTPSGIIKKLIGLKKDKIKFDDKCTRGVDWCSGAFMVFRSKFYKKIGGFDEKFFLYYEDVDICARTWGIGKKVALNTNAEIIHDAQRSSRKSFRHASWHLASMMRYFCKYFWNAPQKR